MLLIATPGAVAGQGLEWRGQIAFEPRFFLRSPAYNGQMSGVQLSGFIEPELRWRSEDRNTELRLTPFLRLDARDDERTHADVREAYVQRTFGDVDMLFGISRVFWGVAEARHLVNIINQVDAVEDINEEDFLGQPMFRLGRQTDVGRFDVFLMPGFRARTFPGRAGRLRSPVVIDSDGALYESSKARRRPEFALRYSHFFGDLDLGLHVFHGTGREPERFTAADGGRKLVPHYNVITQVGADLQYTRDAWLWKFEGLIREGQGDTFAAAVAGVEYTIFQFAESNTDVGLLAEALYDGRDDDVFPTAMERDFFLGTRLTFNDVSGTNVLAGILWDLDEGPTFLRMEAGRRIGQDWKIEAEGSVFFEQDENDLMFPLRRDSFLTLRLSRFF